jgi:hypothetical protein
MKFQQFSTLFVVAISSLFFCTSCNSDDGTTEQMDPRIIESYYIRGNLDGEPLNIEHNIFDVAIEPITTRLDFGPSQTDEDPNPGSGFCYSLYACGIFQTSTVPVEDITDTAKMYFTWIPVGECTLANELIAMRDFLARTDFDYNVFSSTVLNLIPNSVGLDFFSKEYPNGDVYFSSRFGDNSDATFQITAVDEIEEGVFIVEGNFSCKLYKFNDATEFKNLQNAQFKIRISSNLDS